MRRHTASSKASISATASPKTRSTSGRSKGVGRVYQQTVLDTYAKVAFTKHAQGKAPVEDEAAALREGWRQTAMPTRQRRDAA
jgi:hypothetical protein